MATSTSASSSSQPLQQAAVTAPLPRITIQFCTQCKWMLRAAYFAQELLSTFSLSLGEVALQPSTGGTFIVTIHHLSPSLTSNSSSTTPASVQSTTLWDRKTDGGFPETKELKRRVRDVIDPSRDLGHVDRNHRAAEAAPVKETAAPVTEQPAKQEQASSTIVCEDCT
ncbi:Rdx family-domain-containing protein [Trichoderma sp. SZMC 28011]